MANDIRRTPWHARVLPCCVLGGGDAGEHQEARTTHRVCERNVRVRSIPHHKRPLRVQTVSLEEICGEIVRGFPRVGVGWG